MKFFDAKVKIEHTFHYTQFVDVTVEASSWEEAEALALKAAQPAELEATIDSSRMKKIRREVAGIAHLELADFLSRPPERRHFDTKWLKVLESDGITDGYIAIWTEEAKRIGQELWETGRADGGKVSLPDNIRALVDAPKLDEPLSRHPGWFAKNYVDVVAQLNSVLVGANPDDSALIVELSTNRCVGVLMPLKEEVKGAVRAPEV